jgi:hypothetical protein
MRSLKRWLGPAFALGALMTFAACGAADIGESCSEEADSDECVDGAFCAKSKSGVLQCMRTCVSQSDCPADTECTGAKDTTKVCQPN